jgi:hypothetical protein
MTSAVRRRLPDRRGSETFSLQCGGLPYIATISRFENGPLGEIFLTNHKSGSDTDTAARDSAVVCSIALQFGTDVETIRKALSVVCLSLFGRASSACVRLCMASHIDDLEICAMANAKREQVTVTLDLELRAAIKRAAEAEHRSMSNQIKHLVARALEQQRGGAAA